MIPLQIYVIHIQMANTLAIEEPALSCYVSSLQFPGHKKKSEKVRKSLQY